MEQIAVPRMTRLTALVSVGEAAEIGLKAKAAGLSVSAYLRERALDEANGEKFDALLGRMESDLDEAIGSLDAVLGRMAQHG